VGCVNRCQDHSSDGRLAEVDVGRIEPLLKVVAGDEDFHRVK
jgi:hypothetical protein